MRIITKLFPVYDISISPTCVAFIPCNFIIDDNNQIYNIDTQQTAINYKEYNVPERKSRRL